MTDDGVHQCFQENDYWNTYDDKPDSNLISETGEWLATEVIHKMTILYGAYDMVHFSVKYAFLEIR